MALFEIENLTFSYPGTEKRALNGVTLSVEPGEFVVLCGKSGSGKTTLLRHLKTALTPFGTREGEVRFRGMPLEKADLRTQTEKIGFVLQDPDSQIVTDRVWHELAFGLESLGVPNPEIRLRVAEMADYFGIEKWFRRDVAELSGGQKQLLNLASVMAMQPEALLLDEPTAQLDPIAAADFLGTVRKLNQDLGVTVLLSEHRLENVFPMADRAVVMDDGKILAEGEPDEVGEALRERNAEMFAAMPAPMRIWSAVEGAKAPCPLTVRDGRRWLSVYLAETVLRQTAVTEEPAKENTEENALELREVWFRYEKEGPDVLRGADLAVPKGALFAVLGGNGAGKSTLLKIACGVCRPYRGKALLFGKRTEQYKEEERFSGLAAMLPQDPRCLFVKKTVREDLEEMLSGQKLSAAEKAERIGRAAAEMEIAELLDTHPYDLSGGEQQRAALAKVLLTEPRLLLLDEPTKGIDAFFKRKLAELLRKLTARGVTVVLVSHDVEFCASYADRAALLFDGEVAAEDTPRRFFSANSFYTTAASRMSRHLFSNAVTEEDVISLCRSNRA